ncbi:tyrosine-type recombinase/integrase [Salinirubellus salinus]|uniref:Tyrosine-type recombinase/integrase n=1 Tax=Salinirubellus salinus TaxID=1364945 RepID=A0A9E7R6P5_9EURY|nr:tyrosine-type recombinase/integrase [Salinirubellus salinus]UWM55675.1 tyrosine-type recombinase/integrase [Salinirubellus salinus]
MSVEGGTPDSAEDPVAYFLQDITYHGKTQRTRDAYERVLRRCERFLGTRGVDFRTAGQRDCMAWVHSLRGDHAPSTVATYASYLHRFYAYMTQVEAFDGNPMALVMEEMDESIDTDPARREVDVPTMRAFVADIRHPLDRALVVTLLKTGMRVGELCNLDLRDLHLEDPEVNAAFEARPRAAVENRPDTLYVASEPSRGHAYNGEERTASNKRKRDTVIPVDAELRSALRGWLAVRPDTRSPADPLFLSTRDRWGERLTPKMVRNVVRGHAEARGWHREGGDAAENVTPHYFRHFFTTHLRDRTGDRGVVKYLRGDVASDVIDTYTHNWGDRVRSVYEANVYAVL